MAYMREFELIGAIEMKNDYVMVWKAYEREYTLADHLRYLDTAISRAQKRYSEWFNASLDPATLVNYEQLRRDLESRLADVPREDIPLWLRDVNLMRFQYDVFIKPFAEQANLNIRQVVDDPYIPGVSIDDTVRQFLARIEVIRNTDLRSRGWYNVEVESKSENIKETLNVQADRYFEKVYKTFIVDIDSKTHEINLLQWTGKILAWLDQFIVTAKNGLRGYVFTASDHARDPFHMKLLNLAGLLEKAFGLEIKIVSDRPTSLDFVFRKVDDLRNTPGSVAAKIEKGTQVLRFTNTIAGIPLPLPSFGLSIYPKEKDPNVKIDEIKPLSLWNVLG